MMPLKAPGSYSFHATFFQNQWDNIGGAIYDLVIFSPADSFHSSLLKNFLSNFCELSGLKVNAMKMNVFFFTSVKEYLRSAINDTLGFQEVNDLGHYLRASLFHRRITNSILNFLVEKARSQLPSWDAKRLSFAGRVILAQSILLTILSYLMQSTLVPKEIYESIEELARQFIWGVADGKRKMALVGWDSICQPKLHGGLKFRRLGDQNKAFMLKLGYSLITKTEALWVQILKPKYNLVESMTESIMRNRCSYIWKAVAQVWPLLRSNMIWSIGNERSVRCWRDNWVPNVGPLNQYVSGHGNIVLESKVKEMAIGTLTFSDCGYQKKCWAKHCLSIHNEALDSRPKQTSICQNSGVCVYLNTDSAIHSMFGFFAAGGVIRDSKGKWILGYNHFFGNSVTVAKLWGILDGLLLLQKQGYDEIIVLSDNLENVISICENKLGGPKNSLVKRI
ncbi:hypothetical protein PVK06_043768 [Gossypium arboreum]|uniref:RNase H type-1 domain-containing protein n=1 Tax=Gossypium arboreum TaxID=29729 RepID=A0ABR0MPH5_GOSAR|nr:hypothetical protein PVK06_043768 [Gossypium arboreum]